MDATPLAGARTGVGVAVAGMVAALAGRSELRLVGYGLTGRGATAVRAALPAGVRPARPGMPAAVLLRAWRRFDAPVAEHWVGKVDVVHGTNFVVPPTRSAARVVYVHDLSAVHYPELCTPTSRRYPELVARALAGGATAHTGSRFVADEIVEHFSVPAERVAVIPPGVETPAVTPPPDPAGPPYVLALGRAEPRKDLPGLVAAWDRMAGEHPDLELWLAGPPGWGEDALAAAVAAARHRERIRRTGWVADPGPLLAGATVFCYPSRYEGFGFPPLEAMAAGVPVVATAAGAVPEVVGDAARLVPVGDVDALSHALAGVVGDGAERARLVAAGHRRVACYRWSVAADRLVALYQRLAA